MNKMDKKEVDLMTLEAGQGYFAGRYHSMRPILAEKYDTGTGKSMSYWFIILIIISSPEPKAHSVSL